MNREYKTRITKPQKSIRYRLKNKMITNRFKSLEVKKVDEKVVKDNDVQLHKKKKPAVEYSRLGLPRVLGKGARMAHKQWLEENGYERN